jgi:uncharacterized membrane protein
MHQFGDPQPASPALGTSAPGWVRVLVGALSLAGLAVATYLTIAHYNQSVTLACPETGIVNCAKVTSSPESQIAGIPVAVLGVVFYLIVGALSLPAAWERRSLDLLRLGIVGAGVLMVLWLVYAEIVRIGSICLWCTSVHLITVVTFLILLWDYLNRRAPT